VIATEREQAPFADVRFWHKADMELSPGHVRFWGKADITEP
jgi:hypothetical protein